MHPVLTVEISRYRSLTTAYNLLVAYLKAILAGVVASALTYLCFLTWIHMKAASIAEERGSEGLIGVSGSQAYVLHSPAFWVFAVIAFGVGFFLFRDS
jgi:hypothetical protein